MDPTVDDLPPPPAYSEQEFDQKISRATTLSLQTPQAPQLPDLDEDGWPAYDPATFEAVANHFATHPRELDCRDAKTVEDVVDSAATAQAGPSVIKVTKPLRIVKKSQQPSTASVVNSASKGNLGIVNPDTLSPGPSSPPPSAGRRPLPSTSFAAPSRSSTPTPWTEWSTADTPEEELNLPAYPPSSPSSPRTLHVPRPHHQSRPSVDSYYYGSQSLSPVSPRYSMPTQQTQPPVRLEERPLSYTPARVRTPDPLEWAPRVAFDPSVAYNTPARPPIVRASTPQIIQPPPTVNYDPHSLYNSAVVPHLGVPRPASTQPQTFSPQQRPNYVPTIYTTQPNACLSKPAIIQPVQPPYMTQYGSPATPQRYGYSQTDLTYNHGGPTN